jgi:hypothetical protein
MTAKELLLERAPTWSEEQAERALLAADVRSDTVEESIDADIIEEPQEMASAPESWGWDKTAWGTPMPNVVAWVDQARQGR